MKKILEDKYNPFNTLVKLDNITEILFIQGIKNIPNNLELYQQCFVHRSYLYKKKNKNCPENIVDFFPNSNERLEFLGDSIISSIIVTYLFKRYPNSDEGFLTRLKTDLVKTDALASFSQNIGLAKYLIISKRLENQHMRTSARMLEDLFEAFIAALYLDLGYIVTEQFVITLLEKYVDFEDLVLNDTNYKAILDKKYRSVYSQGTIYKLLPNHNLPKNMYQIVVVDPKGNVLGKAVNNVRKKAEQEASKMALDNIH
jgi:ribonuclease III